MTEPSRASEPQDGPAYFGLEVRYAREHAGKTQKDLAEATLYQVPYVSKVENGKQLGSESFAAACDRFFRTSGYFSRLRDRICERGHPAWFVPYLKLEREAATICDYSNAFIMGILQTPEYAEAVFRAAHPRETAEDIKRRVEARLQRRQVMEAPNPPLLWVILHESILRTVVGSTDVMRGQLRHLLNAAESPHVVLQVLPFRAGAPTSHLPFIVLTQHDGQQVLYVESPQIGGQVHDSATDVAEARAAYDRLRASALSADDSLALIREVMEAYVP
ncbi:Scr1 family TA system antitoxin-like transcriptional regulator [Streptomyces sp. C36]|uniref:helix-turn-helix domain-containing protein n=1 Tax=Streptomyces sp. C36 TaxID=3237122 RepID=UPI0034C5E06F